MSVVALVTWSTTVVFGLYLLAIWLIEYDRDYQGAPATSLPVPVISAHAVLAVTGLVVWVVYLVGDQRRVAWAAAIIVLAAAVLGLIMAARWARVYRAGRRARQAAATAGPESPRPGEIPAAERNFPLPVVVSHGIFAAATIVLVLLTAAGFGES